MNHRNWGDPAPKKAPRDFFALTGVAVPRHLAQSILPFPIPNLFRDSLLGMYITPALAKHHPDREVQGVFLAVRAYLIRLRDVMRSASRGNKDAEAKAMRMLRWPEARELRYGYAVEGSDGSGLGGGKLARQVYRVLARVPELLDVAIDVPDVLALIPHVSIDRMGDFIGSVAKDAIIAQTQSFASRYFPGSACIREMVVPWVWDSTKEAFVSRRVSLPVADDGHAILLPHKKTVRSSPPLRAKQFGRFIGRADMTKPEVMDFIAANPGVLRKFADEMLADEWRYLPRRIFRD